MEKNPLRHHTARLGVATRNGWQAEAIAARQDLEAAKLERAIRTALALDPPLRSEQQSRLVDLLANGGAK